VGGIVGVGVDLCEVDRMASTLVRTPGFAARVFTQAEREVCDRRRNAAECYAARFAAKEAALKALGRGVGACPMQDIEVIRTESGAPELALHGKAATLAADAGVTRWHLSLTHTTTTAAAIAVAEGS
jgi:holo-[acyl-carrier protein] synthase